MSYGWLSQDDGTQNVINGFPIDREKFPTRYIEYEFVRHAIVLEQPKPGLLVDAASGFNPEIHLFPEIMEKEGWYVLATDGNPASLSMPCSIRITRFLEDITGGWYTKGLDADVWTCISTLEELQPIQQLMLAQVAFETLRPGGLAVLTADLMSPKRLAGILRSAGFEVGDEVRAAGPLLVPRVAAAVVRKPLERGLV
jgi:hypothetical protein